MSPRNRSGGSARGPGEHPVSGLLGSPAAGLYQPVGRVHSPPTVSMWPLHFQVSSTWLTVSYFCASLTLPSAAICLWLFLPSVPLCRVSFYSELWVQFPWLSVSPLSHSSHFMNSNTCSQLDGLSTCFPPVES